MIIAGIIICNNWRANMWHESFCLLIILVSNLFQNWLQTNTADTARFANKNPLRSLELLSLFLSKGTGQVLLTSLFQFPVLVVRLAKIWFSIFITLLQKFRIMLHKNLNMTWYFLEFQYFSLLKIYIVSCFQK